MCQKIPLGKVATYKEIALALGTKGYRAVGQALRRNPYAPAVPCHRVISEDGTVGGFKGKTKGKELEEKIRLLEKEGVNVVEGRINLRRYSFKF